MNHRLFSTAAALAALAATFAGPSFYASSSEKLVARLPVISETSASATSKQSGKTLPATDIVNSGKVGWPLETGPVETAAVGINPLAPGQAKVDAVPAKAAQTRIAEKEQPAASPQATVQARSADARTAKAKPQDLENSPQFAAQRYALDGTTVQQASATKNVFQAPIAAAPHAEGSTALATQLNPQASNSNVELTAYTHLQALNEIQFDPSVSTGRIEQDDYATRADHTDIHPVYVDDRENVAGANDVDALEQLPPGVYTGDSYDVACGPNCHAHDHGGWLWTFGVEETFLVPDRDGTLASVTVSSPFETFSATSKESMEFGPRFWVGIQKPHWQLLARVWLLNSVDNEYDPVLLGTGDRRGTIVDDDVQAFTADFEAQRLFIGADGWNHYVGFGYRYAYLEDVSRVTATALDTTNPIPAVVQADAFALSKIDGSGVTVSFGATKPLHINCCAQLDFFYNMRGSLVFGTVDTAVQTSVVALDPNIPGAANRFDAASATGKDELFIGELQIGARWTHELKCMPGIAFVQAAFEYQWWDADGGIAMSESVALLNANSGVATAISGPNTEISLLGFALGAGMVW